MLSYGVSGSAWQCTTSAGETDRAAAILPRQAAAEAAGQPDGDAEAGPVAFATCAKRACSRCANGAPESRYHLRVTVDQVISSDPEVQGGAVVFTGTRVPLKNLMDYLEAGDSLEEFLDDFPSVTREQAVAALELAQEALVTLAGTR